MSWTDVRSRVGNDPADQVVRELLHGVPWRRIEDIQQSQPLPEGVYRWEITEDELLAAGVDPGDAYTNGGLQTFTVEDGTWLHRTDSETNTTPCGGTYEIQGSRIVFTSGPPPICGSVQLVFSGKWESAGDGIRFTAVQPANVFNENFWTLPWQRIG